jgi:hypothetical protein
MNNLNEQLYNLYASKWDDISETLHEIYEDAPPPNPTNPFLLYIDEEKWKNADLRVMIFGQETKDWLQSPGKSIDELRAAYDTGFNKTVWNKRTPFRRSFAKFKEILGAKYPDKQISYVWNNIIKIGKESDAGRPGGEIYEAECGWFHVIPDEVKILKPNVILFFSGSDYDDFIRANFGKVPYSAISPYGEKQLAKISIPGIDFAFRTYHPGGLQRHPELGNINDYLNAIVQEIML